MTFNTPQADIDRCLAIEESVTMEERALYWECMNGRPLSQRVSNPSPDEDIPGRDVRDGCILTWVFVRCHRKPVEKKRRSRKEEDRKKQQQQQQEQDERDIEILDKEAGHL